MTRALFLLLLFIPSLWAAIVVEGWEGTAQWVEGGTAIASGASLGDGPLDLTLIFPSTFPIERLELKDVVGNGRIVVSALKEGERGYLFLPEGVTFSSGALYVRPAVGKALYKCDNYSSTEGCLSSWVMVEQLKEGSPYIVNLSPSDPAWREELYVTCYCSDCASCNDLLVDPTCDVVQLTADVASSATCIDVYKNADRKTFDCAGNLISFAGGFPSAAISVTGGLRDFTVANCPLVGWDTGVVGRDLYSFTVSNISLKGTRVGFSFTNIDVLTLEGAYAPTTIGVKLSNVSNATMVGNEFITTSEGIWGLNLSDALVRDSLFNGSFIGLRVNDGLNVGVFNNSFWENKKSGIYIYNVVNASVDGNSIYNTTNTSIDPLGQSQWACDEGNENFTTFEAGITVCHSTSARVSNNYVEGNGTCDPSCGYNHDGSEAGILLYNTTSSSVVGNVLLNAGDNYGIHTRLGYQLVLANNSINGSIPGGANNTNDAIIVSITDGPVYVEGNNLSNTVEWGVFFTLVNNSVVRDNEAHHIMIVGYRIADSYNVELYNNTAYACYEGIRLQYGGYHYVHDNHLFSNTRYGINIYRSNSSNITRNVVENNPLQINVVGSYYNVIFDNIFNASTGQGVAYDSSGGNYWNGSYDCSADSIIGRPCRGGNWYSNYSGVDDGSGTGVHAYAGDGIGDNPDSYAVGSATDYLPLTLTVTGYCNCDSCGMCEDRLNRDYCLYVEAIADISSTGVCINSPPGFLGKTFDCSFHSISYVGLTTGGIGIAMYGLENNTIANCSTRGFSVGWEIENSTNLTAYNVAFSNNDYNVLAYNLSLFNLSNALSENASTGMALTLGEGENFITHSNFSSSPVFCLTLAGGNVTVVGINVSNCDVGVQSNANLALNESLFTYNTIGLKSISSYASIKDSTFVSNRIGVAIEGASSQTLLRVGMNWNYDYGVSIYRSSSVYVGDGSINYSGIGVWVDNSNDVTVYSNTFYNNKKAAVMVNATTGFAVDKNMIYNTTNGSDDPLGDFAGSCDPSSANFHSFEFGIGLCNSQEGSVYANIIESNGTCNPTCGNNHDGSEAAILLYNSQGVNITNNVIKNGGDNYGIALSDSRDVLVDANQQNGSNGVEDNTNDGIIVRYSDNVTVTNNYFHNNYEWGIFFPASTNAYIAYNSIANANLVGIRLPSCSNMFVRHNWVENTPNGIRISAYASEQDSFNITLYNNTVLNATRGAYVGKTIYPASQYGDVENISIEWNNFTRASIGVEVEGIGNNISIANNWIELSSTGVWVHGYYESTTSNGMPTNVSVDGNTIRSSTIGVLFNGTQYSNASFNYISLMQDGIVVDGYEVDVLRFSSDNVGLLNNTVVQGSGTGLILTPRSTAVNVMGNYICHNALDIDNSSQAVGAYDTCRSVNNWQEDGHPGCFRTCSNVWHIFYGYINASLVLGYDATAIVYQWPWSGKGKLYVKNADVAVDWYSLYPLGRAPDGLPAEFDFDEADTVLGITGEPDSIAALFSTDGTNPIQTVNLSIFGRYLTYIPTANSTLGTEFYTGILWDGSDSLSPGDEFKASTNQDLVFFSLINNSSYAHYEVMVPASLATYKGTSGLVEFWLELE